MTKCTSQSDWCARIPQIWGRGKDAVWFPSSNPQRNETELHPASQTHTAVCRYVFIYNNAVYK